MKTTTAALLESASKSALSSLTTGSLLVLSLGLASTISAISAEEDERSLPDTTIIANRTATPLAKVGSSVTVLDVGLLSEQGVTNLDQALKLVPGVISDSVGGQRGSTSDLYIRGLRTAHTHIVVDGMRISDANSGTVLSKQFLGSNNINGLSQIEILRGPQGALYGGDSIGGVLGLYTAKGEGGHSGGFRLEAGSFNSLSSTLGFQGSDGTFSYSLSLGHERTDNDLPHNAFEMDSYSLRLDYDVNDALTIGLTLRGADATYQGPQTGLFYSGPDNTNFNYILGTLFAEYEVNDYWTSKLTLGVYDQDSHFVSRAPTPGFPPYIPPTASPTISWASDESLTKLGIYWDNTIKWNDRHTTVTGLVYEDSDYLATDFYGGRDDRTRNQYGLYVNHSWSVTDQFNVSGGVRWEDHSDDGANGYNDDVFTWRVASSYTSDRTQTTIRGSLGHGFRIPSYTELNGNPGFMIAPNPNLKPVESLGWDLGIEQPFCDGQYTLGVTYFSNRLENAITNPGGGYINTPGVSETSGIEASAKANFLNDRLSVTVSYTWLDRALVDLPDNTLGLRIHGQITERLQAGLDASYLDSRSYGGNTLSSYTLVNLYGNYEINENVALNLRVENLLDKNYEYYNGFGSTYPGRGRGIFGGVTITW